VIAPLISVLDHGRLGLASAFLLVVTRGLDTVQEVKHQGVLEKHSGMSECSAIMTFRRVAFSGLSIMEESQFGFVYKKIID